MITHVAIKTRDKKVWSLPKPNRHGHVIHEIHYNEGWTEAKWLLSEHTQGFLNDNGEFLTREEALCEAKECNQIIRRTHPKDLYSEDLW